MLDNPRVHRYNSHLIVVKNCRYCRDSITPGSFAQFEIFLVQWVLTSGKVCKQNGGPLKWRGALEDILRDDGEKVGEEDEPVSEELGE